MAAGDAVGEAAAPPQIGLAGEDFEGGGAIDGDGHRHRRLIAGFRCRAHARGFRVSLGVRLERGELGAPEAFDLVEPIAQRAERLGAQAIDAHARVVLDAVLRDEAAICAGRAGGGSCSARSAPAPRPARRRGAASCATDRSTPRRVGSASASSVDVDGALTSFAARAALHEIPMVALGIDALVGAVGPIVGAVVGGRGLARDLGAGGLARAQCASTSSTWMHMTCVLAPPICFGARDDAQCRGRS